MKKIFAVAVSCQGVGSVGKLGVMYFYAHSDDEAVGIGIKWMQEQFPVSAGYHNHIAYSIEIPPDFIDQIYPLANHGGES